MASNDNSQRRKSMEKGKFMVQTIDPNIPLDVVPEVRVTDADGLEKLSAKKKHKAVTYALNENDRGVEVTRESSPLADNEIQLEEGTSDDINQMDLYEEEYQTLPPMSRFFTKLANYTGGIEPTSGETKELKKKQGKKVDNKLGTILGVYFPCIQNIFGVLLFIRLVWIVGVAGALQGFLIVLVCCCTTTLTAISMSAIATNGKVPAGGSYFMISRSLGPEFGGAVGILFYLGTTVAAAMYIIGAVEIFLVYMAPVASLFGEVTKPVNLFNNTRVYGTIILFIMMSCVFIGIRFVSKFATVSLACVLFSILSIYIGIFTASPARSPKVCSLGPRLLDRSVYTENDTIHCNKNASGPIYSLYCSDPSSAACTFFNENNITEFDAIPGLASGVIKRNFYESYFSTKGTIYGKKQTDEIYSDTAEAPIISDITSTFAILIAIFFPSVTGIMAGSNRSGDLTSPQKSIPLGTLLAILTTSFVYLSAVVFFASTIEGSVMRDKFGKCIGGGLIVSHLAWPHYWVILIGSFLSTIGAGLQSLTGAPRLLQAIAQDNVIPFLDIFKVTTKRGEPLRAQLLTWGIAQAGVLIASIDEITPLITMFFLMCYGFVNLATALNGFLKEPSWRPRFRHYHWLLSLIGLFMCVALMFVSSWYYALVSMALAGFIYKYIEYRGASKEWGDATRGFQLSAAKKAIIQLGDKPIHTKNWRPQLLVFVEMTDNMTVKHHHILDFCYQLRAGRGLSIVATVLEGEMNDRREDVHQARAALSSIIHEKKIKGLPEVLVANEIIEGMKFLTQSAGLGCLRHNTLVLSYPVNWQDESSSGVRWRRFMALIRTAQACELALVVPKNVDAFPSDKRSPMTGTIDMWCIVHDGGLLLLLAHLLIRSQVWGKCALRVFVVASEKDNNVELRKEVTKFVYDLRITAAIEVVELPPSDISAYAIQRTLDMQMRQQILQEMNMRTVETKREFQALIDKHTHIDLTPSPLPGAVPVPGLEVATSNMSLDDGEITPTTPVSPVSPVADGSARPISHDGGFLNPAANRNGTGGLRVTSLHPNAGISAEEHKRANEFTFSTGATHPMKLSAKSVRRMHNAVHLNEMIRGKSENASLVLINLPGPSKTLASDYNYMEYVETLSEGLERVLLVRGSGREVVTVFAE